MVVVDQFAAAALRLLSLEAVQALLREAKLSQYCELFQTEEIDGPILLDLTEHDGLEELGMTRLHQAKLRKWISELGSGTQASAESTVEAPTEASGSVSHAPLDNLAAHVAVVKINVSTQAGCWLDAMRSPAEGETDRSSPAPSVAPSLPSRITSEGSPSESSATSILASTLAQADLSDDPEGEASQDEESAWQQAWDAAKVRARCEGQAQRNLADSEAEAARRRRAQERRRWRQENGPTRECDAVCRYRGAWVEQEIRNSFPAASVEAHFDAGTDFLTSEQQRERTTFFGRSRCVWY